MKKLIILTTLLFFCLFTTTAQEKIKALKIAYLTEQLNLTSSEAEKFWPIYNKNDETQYELRHKVRSEIKKNFKGKDLVNSISEEEAERIIKLKLDTDKKVYECQSAFINKIKNIISYKKIIRLQVAEMEFGRKLMSKYRHQKK